ncbi:MAG: putative dipeptidase PepE [Candidatus Ordinivivax streblomastigis]|uniref:Putative dipeptidase PepE n=1 Tax=Candidatus Ordinivivax streblomastigis TaxID=2540710 RepID=A0A5M8NWB4_9BACT|nr:MAG: putative dipeptidase PepE [Candidatus Ordinivivax streblomastigis]
MGDMGRRLRETRRTALIVLRSAMQKAAIRACIIPTTDPHSSEYAPEHWKTRQWISGFTGSAGTLVVTFDKAGLWTDSRYFLQAEEQLQGSGIELFKAGLPETLPPEAWLAGELSAGETVGLEGAVYSASDANLFIDSLKAHGIAVDTHFSPYDIIWEDRPPMPLNPAFILAEHFSGESASSKIARLLKEIRAKSCDATVVASLDMIAWLFNLRGTDIEYNPVTVAYAFVSEKETVLFMDFRKLTPEVSEYLKGEGVFVAEYEKIYTYFNTHSVLDQRPSLLITPEKLNYRLYSFIQQTCTIHEEKVHPIDYLKAVKNETEIAGFRKAMQRDGVALVKFYHWLDEQLSGNQTVTELDVSQQLHRFRSEQPYFISESFETISAYGAHGAIVHYAVTPQTNVPILPEGLLLIDSGAQYLDGTTDITRTIAVGAVSEEMKKDFTNLLKGHIRLSMAKFPKGTVGMQLDILARQFIWQEGQNFLHGTGHGIGHFLNVHEGPQSIRMNYNPAPFHPGMVTSNEPGLYKAGKYGIRIENALLTVADKTTEFGEYYAFETLTLCPIDQKLIDWTLMDEAEKQWLNAYHQKVWEQLSPYLSNDEKQWLKNQI